jgi:hypothetical protein
VEHKLLNKEISFNVQEKLIKLKAVSYTAIETDNRVNVNPAER